VPFTVFNIYLGLVETLNMVLGTPD